MCVCVQLCMRAHMWHECRPFFVCITRSHTHTRSLSHTPHIRPCKQKPSAVWEVTHLFNDKLCHALHNTAHLCYCRLHLTLIAHTQTCTLAIAQPAPRGANITGGKKRGVCVGGGCNKSKVAKQGGEESKTDRQTDRETKTFPLLLSVI